MKTITIVSVCFFIIIVSPLILTAHPGHGETGGYSIVHYFVEPVHLIITLSSMITGIAVLHFFRKKKIEKKLNDA